MSSDEYFDSWALLQELETKNNNGIAAKNAGYKYSFPTSQKSNKVVMLPGILDSFSLSSYLLCCM